MESGFELPLVSGNRQPLARSLLGDEALKVTGSAAQGPSLAFASDNARQIIGPVSSKFTGPIDKVEAHFPASPAISPESRLKGWLRPQSQTTHHESVYRRLAEDTCLWFLDGQDFQDWLEGSRVWLWMNGAGTYRYARGYLR